MPFHKGSILSCDFCLHLPAANYEHLMSWQGGKGPVRARVR
jgi:hypothetical protein